MVCKNSFRDLGFVYNDWIFHLSQGEMERKIHECCYILLLLSCINVSLKQNATLDLGFSQRGQQRSSKSILGYEVIFCQLRLSNVLHLKIAH